jgi:type III secretory pathway component EscT
VTGLGLDAATVQAVLAFGLLCARVLPLASLVPWLGVPRGPWALVPALTLVLALCLWPASIAAPVALPLALPALAALALRELLIGTVYALALALPVRAFEWAGALTGRFAGEGGLPDAYGRLQLWVAVAAFFSLGGHRVAIAALADSVARRPVGVLDGRLDVAAVTFGSVRLAADAYALAVLLALPVAAAVGFAQLALALAARTAWASATAAAMAPVRAGLALIVVWMSALLLLSVLPRELERGLSAAARLLQAL